MVGHAADEAEGAVEARYAVGAGGVVELVFDFGYSGMMMSDLREEVRGRDEFVLLPSIA